MNDDRLIRDLRALDRPITVDPAFADLLFGRLLEQRRTRSRRGPLLLLAATLLLGASIGAVVMTGGGPDDDPTAVEPVPRTWTLKSSSEPIHLEFAIPADLDLQVVEVGASLALVPTSSPVHDPGDGSRSLPPGARGVKLIDVAHATAHYSNDRPLGVDAASFLSGLRDHPILDADLGPVAEARLGDTPALAVDVVDTAPDAHLDKDGVVIALWPPSRLMVADVGDAIVVVQIWAASPEDLTGWMPDAQRLVDSFRFAEGQ